jgi:hypothetical protein
VNLERPEVQLAIIAGWLASGHKRKDQLGGPTDDVCSVDGH